MKKKPKYSEKKAPLRDELTGEFDIYAIRNLMMGEGNEFAEDVSDLSDAQCRAALCIYIGAFKSLKKGIGELI